MSDETICGYIRPIAICVFRHGKRIQVGDADDPITRELFYRPVGGGIRFGERSEAALRREIREEMGAEIENPQLLGVMENLFTFDGQEGHEVVFVYDAEFKDRSLYEVDRFEGRESNGQPFNAIWIDVDSIGPDSPPLYPGGLVELLRQMSDTTSDHHGDAEENI